MPSDLEILVSKRKTIEKKTNKIQLKASGHVLNPISVQQVIVYLEELETNKQVLAQIHSDIINECADQTAVDVQDDATETIAEKIMAAKVDLLTIKAAQTTSNNNQNQNQQTSNSHVRLPILDLPIFDGKHENWKSFEDLFLATIDNNPNLKDAVKLQYLKSCVRGEASTLLKNLQVTDSNYRIAWAALVGRFENEREISNAILRRLFNQLPISKESSKNLQMLLDTTNECISALKVISVPVDKWDDVLVYHFVEKMDPDSKKQWALTLKGTSRSTFKELTDFVEQHIRSLQAANSGASKPQVTFQKSFKPGVDKPRQASSHHSSSSQCKLCNGNHAIYICRQFTSASPQERSTMVKRCELCFNCLKADHRSLDCRSKSTCKKCDRKLNTLLHFDKRPNNTIVSTEPKSQQPRSSVDSLLANGGQSQVLLQTAVVKVQDQTGLFHMCRVLLDSASEATFITTNCARALGLKGKKTHVSIQGLSSTSAGVSREKVSLRLASRVYGTWLDVEALVLNKVTGEQPKFSFSPDWSHLQNLVLADPKYYEPGPIDILLGSDYYAMIMREGKRQGIKNSPIALHSIFGWVLSGRISTTGPSIRVHHVNCDLDSTIRRFWEIEELPAIKHLTPEEQLCENLFEQTHTRNQSGRYIVKLPFKSNLPGLGSSRESAMRRFKHVERRLASFPEKQTQYNDFMREFEDMEHMEKVDGTESGSISGIQPGLVPGIEPGSNPLLKSLSEPHNYYMPHHCVLKESTTTKLRVVFDASAKTSNGISLNDTLMVGPTVQDNLYNLFLRFRTHPIALKADIAKFYRQFIVHPDHQNYQRIIWRYKPDQPIEDYKLVRVTYGTACGAYLATRCLKQLAIDEQPNFPLASAIILADFYVDDMISGASCVKEANEIYKQMCGIFTSGGMELRKWSSNSTEVLSSIPGDSREVDEHHNFDQDNTIKALGVRWHPGHDSFIFIVSTPSISKLTKRVVLSEMAKVFDPLGFLSPVTIKIKILFQKLWRINLNWDDELPGEMQQEWFKYYNQLKDIEKIHIPRYITSPDSASQQLHGFCDASESAYAAVVFLRSVISDGLVMVQMITGKTKVAPVKTISLPRLELCAAVMLSNLISNVKQATNFTGDTFLWTDSTIVLRWLAGFPDRWKTFVSNRVSEIQEKFPAENWFHVVSKENPADCASRGISPSELQSFSLWWSGPLWLKNSTFPKFPCPEIEERLDMEEKGKTLQSNQVCIQSSLLTRFSTINKLKRVTAYCLRFLNNIRKPSTRFSGPLSCGELNDALVHWVRVAQESEFLQEFQDLKKHNQVSINSKLKNLVPFIDANGILRAGGRLQNSQLPFSSKHQIILPNQHILTTLIIQDCHKTNLHAGFQLLWSILRRDYWIIRSRDTIRFIIRKCIVCRRHRAELSSQLMSSLPSPRVSPGHPFQRCGVDYAGPFAIKVAKGRGNKTFKCYFCIFVCMSVKAIHLEAVGDLTTEAFIAALKRFTARRGMSTDIYSDCGTNFVGADKELQNLLASSQHNNVVAEDLSTSGITWHFNPPSSPHHGGLWEAGVKSVKFHLRRVIGTTVLTFDEFQTVLCQVEACLNSRPLCAISSDPADLDVLTPGHFLVGQPLVAVPEPDLTNIKMNRLSRWQLTQQMFQNFWRRWSSEYLSLLQQRFKWKAKRENVQLGDLVLIKDDNQPPMKWKMGRVIAVHPGHDQCVRVVTVKTSTGEFKRPKTVSSYAT